MIIRIIFFIIAIIITLNQLFAASYARFWWLSKFENLANPYFVNLKHLQNYEHFLLTELY